MNIPKKPQPPIQPAARGTNPQARTLPTAAPPRFQPAPKVTQKIIAPGGRPGPAHPPQGRAPAAPPVYRPQPTPRVLQTKSALPAPPRLPATRLPAAPAAPRATAPPPRVLQPKTAANRPPHLQAAARPAAPTPHRAAPNAGVIQRKVEYDGKSYKGTSERPGWRAESYRKIISAYNDKNGTSYTEDDFDLTALKQDIAHEVAFDTIQGWVVNYLNAPGPMGESSMRMNITITMFGCPSGEQKEAANALDAMVNAKGDRSAEANKLLSIVNSAQMNIRAANKYINRYLHNHFDPSFMSTPGGQHIRATQHTKELAKLGSDVIGNVARTPKATRVVSSDGPAPLGSMTPDTHGLMSGLSYDQPVPKSKNVKSAFSISNSYLSSSKTTTTTTTPTPMKTTTTTAPITTTVGSTSTTSLGSTSTGVTNSSTTSNTSTNSNTTSVPTMSVTPQITLPPPPQAIAYQVVGFQDVLTKNGSAKLVTYLVLYEGWFWGPSGWYYGRNMSYEHVYQ